MSTSTQKTNPISVDDYLLLEQRSDDRHEYIGGQIYAMTGASIRHNRIAINLLKIIDPSARQKNCQVFMSDVKLYLNTAGQDVFYYPDLMVCCDAEDDHPYYRHSPCLLIEILSDSTVRTDQREKLFAYTQIASLQGYLLVAQNEPNVTLHRRDSSWHQTHFDNLDDGINLPCIDQPVTLTDIYASL